MTIQISHDDVLTALVDLHRIADDLRSHRREAACSVDALLDGGWSGAAARGYEEGWWRWQQGCAEVLAGLEQLTDLVQGAHRTLVAQDDRAATAFGGRR